MATAQMEPGDILRLRLEAIDGSVEDELLWAHDEGADSLLVRLVESLIGLAQYPGARVFEPSSIFVDLKELLEIAHASAIGGSFEPLANVIQFCPPQWAITSTHLISVDPGYAIPIKRVREPRWHQHMVEKGWLHYDSFVRALEAARILFDAGKLGVKPPEYVEAPPF